MHYIYILRCQDDSLYTGYTNNIPKRFMAHIDKKGAKYTKSHPPKELIHIECFESKSEALRREYEVKSMTRQDRLHLQTLSVTHSHACKVKKNQESITPTLLAWYHKNKRDLPWRKNTNPYSIWICEIMSQQTRIATMLPYYERFMARFPTVESLANASEKEVLKYWEGLGYYSRARNLHKAAQQIVFEYDGHFPANYETLKKLSGIGDYTASAIASISFGTAISAVDGNALRVVSRITCDGSDISLPQTKQTIAQYLNNIIDPLYPGDFNQAIMELGANICTPTSPHCEQCPIQDGCLSKLYGLEKTLPYKKKSAKQKTIVRAVLLLQNSNNEWLVRKRTENLLHNLWEFPALDVVEQTTKDAVISLLDSWEIHPSKHQIKPIGHATHVFSHIRWEMDGFYVPLTAKQTSHIPPAWHECVWKDKNVFTDEPWPTALDYYKQWAQN